MVAIAQPVWFLPKIQAFPSTYAPTYYRRSDSINFLEPYYGKARVLIEDNALPVNIGDVFNIQTVNGYGATLHKSFYNFLTEPETEATSGLHMDLFNTQFLVSKKPHPELSLKLYDEDREIYVYERPNYMPRAFLASQFEACHQHLPGCDGVMLQTYSDTHIQVNTAADQPDKLVLSEVDYTGWKAYVDNQPVEIQTYGNNTVKLFRSIDVPAGKHTVDFRYKPF